MPIETRADLAELILKTLDFERSHTVDSLVAAVEKMAIAPSFTPMQVRLIVAWMLGSKLIDMRPDGTLLVLEDPCPAVEFFQGSWYATTEAGSIKGPFRTKGDAENVITSLRTQG
jgi:hypothetical protein